MRYSQTESIITQKLVLPLLPRSNPYQGLSPSMITDICRTRDISLSGDNSQCVTQLQEYDKILPDWLDSLRQKIENSLSHDYYKKLESWELCLYGSLVGINIACFDKHSSSWCFEYTKLYIGLVILPEANRKKILASTNRSHLLCLVDELKAINNQDYDFITTEDFRNLLFTGDRNSISTTKIKANRERFLAIKRCPYAKTIYNLYGVSDSMEIINKPAHPLEDLILKLDLYTVYGVAKSLGMIFPPSCTDPKSYLLTNIVEYKEVMIRQSPSIILIDNLAHESHTSLKNYFRMFTDEELFNKVSNVYVPYDSRQLLIENMVNVFFEATFFTPVERRKERSINKETLALTDITDQTVFMIAFGTVTKYYLYELSDLIDGFWNPILKSIIFHHPENNNQMFSKSQMERLNKLLKQYPADAINKKLLEVIDEGLQAEREKLDDDDIKLKLFNFLITHDKQAMRDFINQVFVIGMYMRRWKGPGHPYPLIEKLTKGDWKPHDNVTHELGIGLEFLNQMNINAQKLIRTFRSCQYQPDGGISTGSSSFDDDWKSVIKGQLCFRMASSRFIGTASHYLRVFFRESFVNLDVKLVERIQ